jgi:hypothetical protein
MITQIIKADYTDSGRNFLEEFLNKAIYALIRVI